MKKGLKIICGALALATVIGAVGCNKNTGNDTVKLTIWVSEADKSFATQVVEEFKKKNPDKEYQFIIDIQG